MRKRGLPDNLTKFNTINNKLLNPPGTPLRNIPIKIYLPTTTSPQQSSADTEGQETGVVQASIRTVQGLIAPTSATTRELLFLPSALSLFFSLLAFM